MIQNGEQERLGPQGGVGTGHGATGGAWQRGQALAIVALMLVVLIGFLAVVTDLGNVYAQRRFMQNAADAGALAGARALGLDQGDDAVYAAVDEYAKAKNGAQSCATTIEDPVVTVAVSKTVGTFFASVVGVPSVTVPAVAAAQYSPVCGGSGPMLMPLIISDTEWVACDHPDSPENPCERITIWDDIPDEPGPGDVFSGGRGWLSLGGRGVSLSDLTAIICDTEGAIPRQLEVGDWVNGDDGSKVPAARSFETCRGGQEVILPLYDDWRFKSLDDGDPSDDPGNVYYHISGFAVFHIEAFVKGDTGAKGITGWFVERYIFPKWPGDCENHGLVTIQLVR